MSSDMENEGTDRLKYLPCMCFLICVSQKLIFLPEEGDDEDDPEYNFLAEIDEPDVEDYRNDKAVRITSEFI